MGIQCVVNKMNHPPGCCYQASLFFPMLKVSPADTSMNLSNTQLDLNFGIPFFTPLPGLPVSYPYLKISNVSISLDISRFKKITCFI